MKKSTGKKLLIALLAVALMAALAVFASAEEVGFTDCSENGHVSSDWIVPNNANCNKADFFRHKECKICGITLEREKIQKGEHSAIIKQGISATCLTEGRGAGIFCEQCMKFLEGGSIIPKLPHDIVVVEAGRPATCDEDGITDHTACSMCDTMDSPSEIIPALHHEGGIVEVKKRDKTCLEDGFKMDARFCKLCDHVFSPENVTIDQVIDRAPGKHVFTFVDHKSPTYVTQGCIYHWECTQIEGTTEYFLPIGLLEDDKDNPLSDGTFLFEQVSAEDIILPVIPHDHSWVKDEARSYDETCLTDGLSTLTCEICHVENQKILPAKGHTPGRVAIVNIIITDCEIGGSAEGVTYCDVCGEEISRQTVNIPAMQHVVETWTNHDIHADTAYREGVCEICGKTVREPIDPQPEEPSSQPAQDEPPQNLNFFQRVRAFFGSFFESIRNFFARLFGR